MLEVNFRTNLFTSIIYLMYEAGTENVNKIVDMLSIEISVLNPKKWSNTFLSVPIRLC